MKRSAAPSKKNDDADEESKDDHVKKTLERENKQKVDQLLSNVSAIKQMSTGIGSHLQDEKVLLGQLGSDFERSNTSVRKVMGRMDDLLVRASDSIFCYICLFTSVFIAILVKFT